ncbi:hypothetical protein AAY473_016017 [Plecturocebus cupreus]
MATAPQAYGNGLTLLNHLPIKTFTSHCLPLNPRFLSCSHLILPSQNSSSSHLSHGEDHPSSLYRMVFFPKDINKHFDDSISSGDSDISCSARSVEQGHQVQVILNAQS